MKDRQKSIYTDRLIQDLAKHHLELECSWFSLD